MNWQDIEVSLNRKNFTYKGKTLFKEDFTEVLEFQDPGIAAVKNQKTRTGSYKFLCQGYQTGT